MRLAARATLAGLLALVFLEPAVAGEGIAGKGRPSLTLPIACTPGEDCFIQNYVDTDPGGPPRDYACREATYAGHTGVDIRLLSAAAAKREEGVAVLAAADGTVMGSRDEMADEFPERGGEGAARLKGRECGNGVMLDHGNGWTTQYCHMRANSVVVKPGQRVRRGEKLGAVGYSGMAEFAHVHVTARHDGRTIDPFTGAEPTTGASCLQDPEAAQGLWDAETRAKLGYRHAEIMGVSIAGGTAAAAQLEMDHRALPPATRDSAQLMVVARLIKLEAGERVRVRLSGPGALTVDSMGTALDRAKATWLAWGGAKRPADVARWPAGRYEGNVTVIDANGAVKAVRRAVLDLD